MYIYHKKNDSQKHTNSLGQNFPIDLLSKTSNQYKYNNNIFKANNYIKNNGNYINKNNNTSMNNKSIQFNKANNKNTYVHNHININNSHIIKNNTKIPNPKQGNQNFSYINNNISHNYNNKNKTTNPINTYIINTLNVSEKDFLNSGISTSKPKMNKDYEKELEKLIKEKEESEDTIKKQEKLIEKLEEDNKKLDNKIKSIEYENKKISQKIQSHQENQEQLIMLVKIIQKSGVDVEELIDKWNNEVEQENNTSITNDSNNNESYSDSINELNSKIDPSSFIPINIEEPHVNKKVFNGIPKLNFDMLKNNKEGNRKGKFRNNSK